MFIRFTTWHSLVQWVIYLVIRFMSISTALVHIGLTCLICLSASSQPAVIVGTGYIKQSPSNNAETIKFLTQGDTVTVLEKKQSYYKIEKNGIELGYIREGGIDWNLSRFEDSRNEMTTFSAIPDSVFATIYFDAPAGIPIREKPNVNARELIRCRTGDRVLLMGYKGGEYYRVKYKTSMGFIFNDFLVNNRFAVDSVNYYNSVHNSSYRLSYVSPSDVGVATESNLAGNQKKTSTSSRKATPARTYYTGPRGGVYYIDSNGKKVYKKKD
jgi:Bacterial SH3 domain